MIDISVFRLRAFESRFIVPILNYFEEHPHDQAHARRSEFMLSIQAGETPDFGREHERVVPGLLRILLLAEGRLWIQRGIEIGYFSPRVEPLAAPEDDIGTAGLEALGVLLRMLGDSYPFSEADATEFPENLSDAIEDLTDSRLDFLGLTLLVSKDFWKIRMAELRDLASILRDRPDVTLSSRFMDRVSWAFQGPEAKLLPSGLPSDWRAAATERNPEWARLQELEEVRLEILQAAKRIGPDEQGSIQLRTSFALDEATQLDGEGSHKPGGDERTLRMIFDIPDES